MLPHKVHLICKVATLKEHGIKCISGTHHHIIIVIINIVISQYDKKI